MACADNFQFDEISELEMPCATQKTRSKPLKRKCVKLRQSMTVIAWRKSCEMNLGTWFQPWRYKSFNQHDKKTDRQKAPAKVPFLFHLVISYAASHFWNFRCEGKSPLYRGEYWLANTLYHFVARAPRVDDTDQLIVSPNTGHLSG